AQSLRRPAGRPSFQRADPGTHRFATPLVRWASVAWFAGGRSSAVLYAALTTADDRHDDGDDEDRQPDPDEDFCGFNGHTHYEHDNADNDEDEPKCHDLLPSYFRVQYLWQHCCHDPHGNRRETHPGGKVRTEVAQDTVSPTPTCLVGIPGSPSLRRHAA